ncbi:glycosyltransferase [Mucilaginibacter sp. X4EP1]|uniref:glycosyltransferase n=1 Tax=Mucilaginibacter sp. X4EP1 TaxID=2723092 RepID=UPI002169326B|nr:hypothetical protein [Mucilaginibacter sp. X4EP1]MCS3811707.1 glycosyltransferase involved in cell wall biosynthesis [Mucilaginibacter sp. X4EP1]
MGITTLNIFYEEPDPDRWIKYDRYPRRVIRRLVRGEQRKGGVAMIADSLMQGLERLEVPYRFNDYKHIRNHPDEIACIIGKPQLLFEKKWKNPIIFGAGIYSHPIECPDLFEKYPNIKRILVPGNWIKDMFEPYYHEKVLAWPAGIDIEKWKPRQNEQASFDFLIYDKIGQHAHYRNNLIDPICKILDEKSFTYQFVRYGSYTHGELETKLQQARGAIFLSEHETQGLAYQQILASGIPILAWDAGGFWKDPYYYPEKVKYQPVSAVPYWDERCGIKFTGLENFDENVALFMGGLNSFKPRDFILENLTLEKSAGEYLRIYREVEQELV